MLHKEKKLSNMDIATIGLFLEEINDNHIENLFKILYLLHPKGYNRHIFLTEIMDKDFKQEAEDVIYDIMGGKKNRNRLFLTDNSNSILGLSYHVSIFREKIDYAYDEHFLYKNKTDINYDKGMRILNHKKVKNFKDKIERN